MNEHGRYSTIGSFDCHCADVSPLILCLLATENKKSGTVQK